MADTFQLRGLDDALRRMKTLPDKVEKKAAKSAARAGAVIFKNAAIANASKIDDPETPTNISKNISVQYSSKLAKQAGGVAYRVGVLGGASQYANTKHNRRKGRVGKTFKTAGSKANPGGDTWYWRFVEFGTSKFGARPFLLPAITQNIDAATDAVANRLSTQIDKLVT
jgi:HK97 gp10 family phage protein